MEIEIEVDRNTSTEIDRVSALEIDSSKVQHEAKEFSVLAQKNLRLDLFKIKSAIENILRNDYGLTPLPVTNKYSRIVELLNLESEKE